MPLIVKKEKLVKEEKDKGTTVTAHFKLGYGIRFWNAARRSGSSMVKSVAGSEDRLRCSSRREMLLASFSAKIQMLEELSSSGFVAQAGAV